MRLRMVVYTHIGVSVIMVIENRNIVYKNNHFSYTKTLLGQQWP